MAQSLTFFQTTFMDILDEMDECSWLFSKNPLSDFSRKSKLGFKKTLSIILSLGSKSIPNELLDYFQCAQDIPSASAFVQSRNKLLPETLEFLFHEFNSRCNPCLSYKGFRLLAIDGSELQTPTNPEDKDSYFPNVESKKSYNLLHLNAMYDLLSHTYVDAFVEGHQVSNEQRALNRMIDRTNILSAIVLADRGYESYNCFAHIQEKGWKFLFRVKDGTGGITSGLDLPNTEEFDLCFNMYLTRKQTNEMKELFKDKNCYKRLTKDFDYLPVKNKKSIPVKPYFLPFRIVRFKLTDNTVETVLTNLDMEDFPPAELKSLYSKRWGIETSFRKLKYTIGLLHFHAKKVEYIYQEIFARMIMYNFTEMIISHVILENKSRKHAYQANFSTAAHICRQYFRGNVPPPTVETLIARLILPFRPGRSVPRNLSQKKATSFYYRVA